MKTSEIVSEHSLHENYPLDCCQDKLFVSEGAHDNDAVLLDESQEVSSVGL